MQNFFDFFLDKYFIFQFSFIATEVYPLSELKLCFMSNMEWDGFFERALMAENF